MASFFGIVCFEISGVEGFGMLVALDVTKFKIYSY
jgi:hypothetical protein